MMKTISADEAALALLLRGDDAGLQRLAARVRAATEGREPCPDCGDEGPHDDNGARGADRALACSACGMHFEPKPIVVDGAGRVLS